ncbi:MAG: FHA domain-containing protein [Waterburya sp.]
MITCPSCNHQNPEGSLQCENCYTPLPATIGCPNCGASVQTDATFCGQCGFNLQAENLPTGIPLEETAVGSLPDISLESLESLDSLESLESLEEVSLPNEIPLSAEIPEILPETAMSSPIKSPWDEEEDMTIGQTQPITNNPLGNETTEVLNPDFSVSDIPDFEPNNEIETEIPSNTSNESINSWEALNTPPAAVELDSGQPEMLTTPLASSAKENLTPPPPKSNFAGLGNISGATQLQIQTASLLHLQSNTNIPLPDNLNVVHIGKPNGQIPPDIDVAGFPDSEVVSRVHADIRIEGDAYYIEDIGSSNGTYVNHAPLVPGNRHRLRAGDRVALGKGDLVTFIFQLN